MIEVLKKPLLISVSCFLSLLLSSAELYAELTSNYVLPFKGDYKVRKAASNKMFDAAVTKTEKNRVLNDIFHSKYGNKGLKNMTGSVKGFKFSNPDTPGLKQAFQLSTSANVNQAKGYRRALLYARRIDRSKSFDLLALDQVTKTSLGKTDKDIVFRHRKTGLVVRAEIKNIRESTQIRNLAKYKLQIDKMHESFIRTGEIQAYINRNPIIPELRKYAEQKGVLVFDNVSSVKGISKMPDDVKIGKVLQEINHYCNGIDAVPNPNYVRTFASAAENSVKNVAGKAANAIVYTEKEGIQVIRSSAAIRFKSFLNTGGKVLGFAGAAFDIGLSMYLIYDTNVAYSQYELDTDIYAWKMVVETVQLSAGVVCFAALLAPEAFSKIAVPIAAVVAIGAAIIDSWLTSIQEQRNRNIRRMIEYSDLDTHHACIAEILRRMALAL